jgi:hypothetical protein
MLTTPAPLPVASPLPSALPLEEIIGEIAADAALEIARALRAHQNDELSFKNAATSAFGDGIARLFGLWQVCAGWIDFYAVARARGAHVLRERHGGDLNTRTIVVLIDGVLEALRQVVRAELN